ncbi:MAG: transposase [Acidimicrobiales bacterium]
MKGKRYPEEQIIRILGEVESGKTVASVCRQYGVSEATVHRWRSNYRGMDQPQLKRLKELEAENARLKKIVAEQAMDIDALKDLLGKEW